MVKSKKKPNFVRIKENQKGFDIAKIAKMNAQEYMQYENSRLAYFENKAAMDTAREEGKLEGKLEGKIEVIQNCLDKDLSFELIAQITGLPIEVLLDIIKDLNLKRQES